MYVLLSEARSDEEDVSRGKIQCQGLTLVRVSTTTVLGKGNMFKNIFFFLYISNDRSNKKETGQLT